jgi:hypothetical protein
MSEPCSRTNCNGRWEMTDILGGATFEYTCSDCGCVRSVDRVPPPKWTHWIKSGEYTIEGLVKVKIEGEWVRHVLYTNGTDRFAQPPKAFLVTMRELRS